MAAMPKELESLCLKLPPEKVAELVDFARFLCQQESQSSGDEAWERIINEPKARPKLDTFVQEAQKEGQAEPLDLGKL